MMSTEIVESGDTTNEPPSVVQQHIDSTHKVSTSLFKDIEETVGPYFVPVCCCLLIVAIVVLLVYFVWPILQGLFGFTSGVIGDIEGEVQQVYTTAKDFLEAGLLIAEDVLGTVIKFVEGLECSIFEIDCPIDRSHLACCDQWQASSIAQLVQRGMHVKDICVYGAIQSGIHTGSVCRGGDYYSNRCTYGLTGSGRLQGYYPSDDNGNWYPTREEVLNRLSQAPRNASFLFVPRIGACSGVDIDRISSGEVNPLH